MAFGNLSKRMTEISSEVFAEGQFSFQYRTFWALMKALPD